jgi:hypothetical protein
MKHAWGRRSGLQLAVFDSPDIGYDVFLTRVQQRSEMHLVQ